MDNWLQRNRGYLVLSLAYAILLGGVLIWRRPAPTPIRIVDPTPRPSRTPALIAVHVSGAVLRPDVYLLLETSRVRDAVLAAGGLRPDADPSSLNLATMLQDGQRIHVPAQGEAPLPAAAAGLASGAQAARPINVNTASAKELEELPGVGAVIAQRIVEDRQANGPFAAVEDLARVRGIGPDLLEKMRSLVTVR